MIYLEESPEQAAKNVWVQCICTHCGPGGEDGKRQCLIEVHRGVAERVNGSHTCMSCIDHTGVVAPVVADIDVDPSSPETEPPLTINLDPSSESQREIEFWERRTRQIFGGNTDDDVTEQDA